MNPLSNRLVTRSSAMKLGLALALTIGTLFNCGTLSASAKAVSDAERYGEKVCLRAQSATWHSRERWVWHRLCTGVGANLAEYSPASDDHQLSAGFLRDILAEPAYRDVLPFAQVFISHAEFDGPVDLKDATIKRDVRLDGCTFAAGLSLESASASAPVSLNDVRIVGQLNVAEFHGTSLFLMRLSASRGVDAHDAALTGNLRAVLLAQTNVSLDRASVDGYVEVENSLGSFHLASAHLQDVTFVNARLEKIFAAGAHLRNISFMNVNVNNGVYLQNAVVQESLKVEKSRIEAIRKNADPAEDPCYSEARALDGDNAAFGSVLLTQAILNGFSLDRSTIDGQVVIHADKINRVCMNDEVVHGVLDIADTNVRYQIEMNGAEIERNAYFTQSYFNGLSARQAVFGGSCWLEQVHGDSIDFQVARFARGLQVASLTGDGNTEARSARVGSTFTLVQSQDSPRKSKELLPARVVGDAVVRENVAVDNATVANAPSRFATNVADARLADTLDLSSTDIEGDLKLIDISAKTIDLSGATVTRTLYFLRKALSPSTAASAALSGSLLLRGTVVQTLEDNGRCDAYGKPDCVDPWPRKVELEGFHFSQLGSGKENVDNTLYDRDVKWWKDWLTRGHYVPEAYDTLSAVLQNAGNDRDAKDIAMERRDRDRATAPGPGSFLMLLWRFADGYGYFIYYALIWAFILLVAGAFVLHYSGENKSNHSRPLGLAYSFDMLVPLVFLEKEHETVQLRTWARYYFYGHKIVGYILATFLVAGLSVLAK